MPDRRFCPSCAAILHGVIQTRAYEIKRGREVAPERIDHILGYILNALPDNLIHDAIDSWWAERRSNR